MVSAFLLWQQQQRVSRTIFSETLCLLLQPSCRSFLAQPRPCRIVPLSSVSSPNSDHVGSSAFATQDTILGKSAAGASEHRNVRNENDDERKNKAIWLVVGDGDLSFSASIAPQLAQQGIHLVASVLEDQEEHQHVFRNSKSNHLKILNSSSSHNVLFSIDATRLHDIFALRETNQSEVSTIISFDRIIFNFPHWRGKSNHRYNRDLLNSFFASAAHVLKRPHGELHVVLRAGQGGITSATIEDWKRTWMAPYFAAEHGFILQRLEPFKPEYALSSYRGMDRPFSMGDVTPKRYVFTFADYDTAPVDPRLQMCCRHELRLMLHQNIDTMMFPASDDDYNLLFGDTILHLAQDISPEGIRVEVPKRHLLPRSTTGWSFHALVFIVVYVGERVPLQRTLAESIRQRLEEAAVTKLRLELAKKSRPSSRQFPYPILESLIQGWQA